MNERMRQTTSELLGGFKHTLHEVEGPKSDSSKRAAAEAHERLQQALLAIGIHRLDVGWLAPRVARDGRPMVVAGVWSADAALKVAEHLMASPAHVQTTRDGIARPASGMAPSCTEPPVDGDDMNRRAASDQDKFGEVEESSLAGSG